MRVYVVTYLDDSNAYSVERVFATLERAREFLRNKANSPDYELHTLEVDE